MRKFKLIAIMLIVSILSALLFCPAINADSQNVLAFPTAEGYGRYTDGFRGGRVIAVTNLNDSGEGSLRWALEENSDPRIVVFKVGGVIKLESPLYTCGNVYIAGQTAPGDGITITNYPLRCFGVDDVVIRYIRVRVGDYAKTAMDGIWLSGIKGGVIDHCSTSWAIGSSIIAINCKDASIQNSIFAESLYDSYMRGEWGKEKSSQGALLGGDTLSFLGNLLINNANKNLVTNAYNVNNEFVGKVDIRNNVVYNWYDGNAYGDSEKIQMVGNYFKKGEASITDTYFSLKAETINNVNRKIYLFGNTVVDRDNRIILNSVNDDQWKLVENILQDYSVEEAKCDEVMFESYYNTLSADDAYENIISNVGATVPKRDYIDERYIDELVSGKSTYTGSKSKLSGIIDSQEDVGGYPDETNFTGGEVIIDSDNDGMSDEWELLHGLNPQYYYDACQIYLSDEGYTNVELYINELAGDPVVYSENPTLQYTPVTPTPEVTTKPEDTIIPTETKEVTITDTPVPFIPGDVNNSGIIDAEDALLVLKHAAKLEVLDYVAKNAGDVEADGTIDAMDALSILKYAARIIEQF